MTLLLLVAAFGPSTAAGWALLDRSGQGAGRGVPALSARVGLAAVLGAGMPSLLAYAWLVGGGALDRWYVLASSAIFLAVAGLARAGARPPPAVEAIPATVLERAALWAALAGIVLLGAAFAVEASRLPHGEWDAWAIWNQRARFLLRGGAGWRAAFCPELAYSHPGYPLLLPATVAHAWAVTGESTAVPAVLAATFTLAPALVVLGAVTQRSGAVAGAAATLILLAAGEWRRVGTLQFADTPLAAFVAAAAAVLTGREDELPGAPRLALAGVLFGLAGWTKDEGVVIALLFSAWLALRAGRAAPRWLACLAAGAALPAIARLHFQATLAPGVAVSLTAGQTAGSLLERLLDPERWATILSVAPRSLPGVEVGLPAIVLAVPWLLGARPRGLARSLVAVPALGAYAVYLLVYAVTPLDLEWHIVNSAPRILEQPWPALVIGLLSLVPAARPARATAPAPAMDAGPARP